MNVLVQHPPRIIPVKPRRRTCAKAVSFPRFAEAVNGRASMYGVVFGGSNWALTGLNISEQMHQRPLRPGITLECSRYGECLKRRR